MTLAITIAGWSFGTDTVIIGVISGLCYALLAAGLVLVYRATRIINLAHGEIGALGAAVLAKIVLDWHWNFFLALAAVLALGGAIGAAVELGIIRRLFDAPRLVLLVATIGVAQLLLVLQFLIPDIEHPGAYPTPLDRTMTLGGFVLQSHHLMVIAFVPAIVVGLWLFLTRTPAGIAIRAAADNPDRAELAGIPTRRVSTAVWMLTGVLSTLTAVLLNPVRGVVIGLSGTAVGPGLLVRALAAALIGGLTSLPRALLGGILVGVGEALVISNVAEPGLVDALLFVAVLVLVLFHGKATDDDSAGNWSLTPAVKAIPEGLRQVGWVRHLNLTVAAVGLAFALALPVIFTSSAQVSRFTDVLIFAIVGLSVTVLTGWTGQLSLGQFALVGLGAVTATSLVAKGVSFPAAVAYGAVAGSLAALVIGFPALRVRGPFLAVTTLSFAVAAQAWLYTRAWFAPAEGSYWRLPRGELFGFLDLRSSRTYYLVCLVVLVICVRLVTNVRASGAGRRIVAIRENEPAASCFGVVPAATKLSTFALSGGLAGLAGALLAGSLVQFTIQSSDGLAVFGPQASLQVISMTVIGGLGSVGGALVGAAYVVGLPVLFGSSPEISLAVSGIGLLVLLLYVPGGLMQVVYRARDVLLDRAARRLPPQALRPGGVAATPLPARDRATEVAPSPSDIPVLVAQDVHVHFGGRIALDSVSVTAKAGEVVGLIGSNGAGKSTLLNVISGLITPDHGRVTFLGQDITGLAPHARARLGIGRVFQDARLFGDLTVTDTVKIALESHEASEFVPSMLGLPPSRRAERRKADEAAAHVAFLGLERYADAFIADLSTGTRRIVELCCLLAQRPRLLLLDEPTAGVAQREAEAFGPLIKRIQAELGATVVIIEHDIPLIMSISDRIYCLAAGREIAEGLPADVRSDPAVIAAYLGTDERAIARSGAAPGAPAVPSGNGTNGSNGVNGRRPRTAALRARTIEEHR